MKKFVNTFLFVTSLSLTAAPSYATELHEEMIGCVMSFLPLPDLERASAVCRRWREIAKPFEAPYVRMNAPGADITKQDIAKHCLLAEMSVALINFDVVRYLSLSGKLTQIRDKTPVHFFSPVIEDEIVRKSRTLADGDLLRRKNPDEAKKLPDWLASLGIEIGVQMQIEGSLEGKYGYLQNLREAQRIMKQRADDGSPAALTIYFSGQFSDIGKEYEKHALRLKAYREYKKKLPSYDHELTKEEIEEMVAKGDDFGIEKMIEGLLYEMYGIQADKARALEFIHQKASAGSFAAIRKTIQGYWEGRFGFSKDPEALKEFIKELIASDNENCRRFGLKFSAAESLLGAPGDEEARARALEVIRVHKAHLF